MHYKASTITPKIPEKMASTAPVAIGTRGTVGSLVRKEIEYFTKFELDRFGSSRKIQEQVVEVDSKDDRSKPAGFWSLKMSWKRKKRSRNSGFLRSICSVVEVNDTNQLNGIPGFSYINLKDDTKNMHI
ncbi:hypothetical protein K2173_004557 [Erythroxylum novogranatense]|uniref:Uncharacterized protein n=1 Tax=Erythroxylum novogranatense TaxID=1862640 RepID=A0AAV8T4X4_9ROSI|nr:hypothetical protein K2173_004557 [Erythroxylum novogranatense]